MRGRSLGIGRVVIGGLVLAARSARADDSEPPTEPHPIDTDRPHKTDTPHTVPPGRAQIEMGVVEYAKASFRTSSDDRLVFLDNEYRLGLTRTIDAEALFATGSIPLRSPRVVFGNRLALRAKIGIFGDDETPMMVTIVPTLVVPVAPSGTFEGGGFVFFGAELPLELDLELNAGALTETIDGTNRRRAVPVLTTALTRRLGGPVSAFGEIYSETRTDNLGGISSTLDAGVLVLLGANTQVDAGGYLGLWGSLPAFTGFLGFSIRW